MIDLPHAVHLFVSAPQDASYEEGLPYLRGMPEAFARCADVTLAVGARELPVHSQVLASKSAFFAGMWAGGPGPQTRLNTSIGR